MKKRLALTLATAGVLALGGGVATAFAVQGDDDRGSDDRTRTEEPVPTGAFTAAQAAETAAKTASGVVTDVDWDHDRWEVDVRTKDGKWHDVVLDQDGKVLSNQPDAADKDDDQDDD